MSNIYHILSKIFAKIMKKIQVAYQNFFVYLLV